MGAPLGKTKRVTSNGMADTKNEITGYTIVEADSFDAAAKIFKNHPHFKMGKDTTVDLLELVAHTRNVIRATANSPSPPSCS